MLGVSARRERTTLEPTGDPSGPGGGGGGGISARSGGKTGAKAPLPASLLLQQLLALDFFRLKNRRDNFNGDEVTGGDDRIEPSPGSPLTGARGGPAVSVLAAL